MDFPQWLQHEMDKREWSQADLARRARTTRSAINGLVLGTRGPGKNLMVAIAKAFGIPPEHVMRAAGLLEYAKESEITEQMLHDFNLLPPDKQAFYAELIHKMAEDNQRKGVGSLRERVFS